MGFQVREIIHLGKLILSPITKYANHTYAHADALVAVSETYMNRADINHLDNQYKEVVYIGADNLHFNSEIKKSNQKKMIATYIGTMAGSYDLETIVRASTLCHDQVEIQFIESQTKFGAQMQIFSVKPLPKK